jgi:spermidine synthase
MTLDRAEIPGSTHSLELFRRGDEWSIRVAGQELMNSRRHSSEEALSELACARLADAQRESARVLIGGLGMGFTLAAALRQVGARAEVVVAELVPAVLAWNRGPLGPLAGNPLHDRRARVELGDVAAMIARAHARYDAILLDVDNGPDGLTRDDNDALYGQAGLRSAFDALRPGGVLGVWSAWRAAGFTQRLRRIGFSAEEHGARARGTRGGGHHTLWIAVKPSERRREREKRAR